MRFIHTADWHLGNSLFDIDRSKEFESFLKWLKETVVKTKADALVISGDIFDTANPPVSSRKQYNQFLASLLTTSCRNIIIVGGNHDSGSLLDSQKDIFDFLNIHVVGSVNNVEPQNMVFEIKDDSGNVLGVCAAVPYAREIELRQFYSEKVEQGTLSDYAYGELYKQVLEEAKKLLGGKDLPVIATGHLYASGLEGRFENCDKEIRCDDGRRNIDDVIGNLGSVHISAFPDDFSYVALGHIHYTTMVAKNPKVRYSGSPFVLGFDEANLPRHVLLVETENNKNLKVEKIEVPRFFEYRRISGTSEEIKAELEKYQNEKPEVPTYIEAYYKREEGVNIHEFLLEAIEALPENVFVANKKPQTNAQMVNNYFSDMDSEELKNLSQEEIFTSLILSKSNFDTNGLSEKDIEKQQKSLLKKYLPLFMEVAKEIENGEGDENN